MMKSELLKQNNILFNIVLLLLVINFATIIGPIGNMISKISVSLLLLLNIGLLFLILCKNKKVTIYLIIMLVITILYIVLQIFGTSISPNYSRLIIRIFQLVGLVCLYLYTLMFFNISIINLSIYKVTNISLLLYLYFSVLINKSHLYSVALISDISFAFLALNYLLYRSKKVHWIYIIMAFPLVILGGGRTHIVSIMIFIIIFSGWKLIKNKFSYYTLFTFLLIGSFLYTFVYPSLVYKPFFISLNQKFNYYTGENFFSGRQIIWANILETVKENDNIMFGMGSDMLTQELNTLNISAHNQYLEIYAQSGIFGLVIFVSILYVIWIIHYRRKHSIYSRFNIAFLSSLMVMSVNSVCLYQTNMALASVFWFTLGIGTNLALKDGNA